MNIGETIHECRIKKGLTLFDLASKCEISESYLSFIERGKRKVNLDLLEKLSQHLDIPASILVFLSTNEKQIKETNPELHKDLIRLTKELLSEGRNS